MSADNFFEDFLAPLCYSYISKFSCLPLAECGFSCGQNSVRPSVGAIKWFKWSQTRPSLPAPSSSKSCEYFHIIWIPEEGQDEYYILNVPKWFFLVLKGVGATPERYVFFPTRLRFGFVIRDRSRSLASEMTHFLGFLTLVNDLFTEEDRKNHKNHFRKISPILDTNRDCENASRHGLRDSQPWLGRWWP